MCFHHDVGNRNETNNEHNDNVIENTGIGNFIDFSKLKTDFPRTQHKVFLVETLKIMRSNLNKYLFQSNPAFKTTSMHRDNEFAIRFIVNILGSEDDDHLTLTITFSYALPSKPNDLQLQLREVNAVISHIRESKPFLKKSYNTYSKMNTIHFLEMNQSQESIA